MRGRAERERRRREAEDRQAARDKRGDKAQLKKLIDNGHGHCREVDRLIKKLNIGVEDGHS